MTLKNFDYVALPPTVDKHKILAKVKAGLAFFELQVERGKNSPEVTEFKFKHPDWETAYELFLAWTLAAVEKQNQKFLKLIEKMS